MFHLTTVLVCSAALLFASDDLDQQLRSIISANAIAAEKAADPAQFEQLKRMGASTSKVFGSTVSILPGRVVVLQPFAGTSPQNAGLAPMELPGIPVTHSFPYLFR